MTLKKLAIASALASCLIGFGAPAQAIILTDIVWVVDTSGSMGDDITQVKNNILSFNTAMTNAGIDAQYGLVRFGGANTLIQDITTFATFSQAGSPFQLLTANGGGTEDGSAALQVAMGATFRANSVRNFILITDEDDDNTANRAALDTALLATDIKELINIIGNPNDDAGNYYRNLAPAHGGAFFNIVDFRASPQAFFTNFTTTKVQETVQNFCDLNPTDPICRGSAQIPEPGALALLGIGLMGLAAARRCKTV